MSFLFEEFYEKIFRYSDSGSWSFKIMVRIINIILFLGIVFFIGYSLIFRKYLWLLIFLGLILLAELSHFLRKHREGDVRDRKEQIKIVKDIMKPNRAKNKDLLSLGKSKNKNLLSNSKKIVKNKPNNKSLLGLKK